MYYHRSLPYPTLIQDLNGKFVRRIACGCAHSAAVTSNGELYTWGRGKNGWLGHGINFYALITHILISYL